MTDPTINKIVNILLSDIGASRPEVHLGFSSNSETSLHEYDSVKNQIRGYVEELVNKVRSLREDKRDILAVIREALSDAPLKKVENDLDSFPIDEDAEEEISRPKKKIAK
jgi:hypothetical protein